MDDLIDPFARLIEDACPPAAVRAIEAGSDWTPMWGAFAQSGFLDALVDEDAGGAGLSLADIAPLVELLGRHAVPLPVAETMVARGLLVRAGQPVPTGPIAIATSAGPVPLAGVATHALIAAGDSDMVMTLSPFRRTSRFELDEPITLPVRAEPDAVRPVAAVLRALLIAGATARVLEMSVTYANERIQFGKPIGRQQAVQQQLAVMAEHAVAARIAARIGCRSGITLAASAFPLDAALAKHGASIAAVEIAGISHAIHGAIGISAEFDLNLYTRRLHGWRLADGSESYWAARIGAYRLDDALKPSIDVIRERAK